MRLRLTLLERDGPHPKEMAVGESVECPLPPGGRIVIGRCPGVDVYVDALSVGRKVVDITDSPEGWLIRDLGSGGGSALEVDGVLTRRPVGRLPAGAVLWIGQVAFRVDFVHEE